MQAVFVVNKDGKPLMPTYNPKKVRKLLRSGRAKIYRHAPFTIQLLYDTTDGAQPIEYTTDTGYSHGGISIKSEKHEYLHMQADMLEGEKQRHDDRKRHRRTRRNHLRYRKPRFDNRTRKEGWLAPSLQHRMDNQVTLYKTMLKVCPITMATLEVGKFDTEALEAIEQGKELSGTDYQQGPMYKQDTIREAVFYRDGYTCQVCGASPLNGHGTILRMHHALYWKFDHTDRMAGLMTVCTGCHTSANHQEGGKLWGLEPKTTNKAPQAFMNAVRWKIRQAFIDSDASVDVHISYGAATKRERLTRGIGKTHANDAYCIGQFRPKHKAQEIHIAKRRRNNRVLERFRDARYIDIRDGVERTGKELSCGRTSRSEDRHGENNLRQYRGEKTMSGCRCIRRRQYSISHGDMVVYGNKRYIVHGMQNNGKTVSLETTKEVKLSELQPQMTAGKDPQPKPIEAGQNLALHGKKEKHKVLSINEQAGTATMRWYIGVKPDAVRQVSFNYGGWEVLNAKGDL